MKEAKNDEKRSGLAILQKKGGIELRKVTLSGHVGTHIHI